MLSSTQAPMPVTPLKPLTVTSSPFPAGATRLGRSSGPGHEPVISSTPTRARLAPTVPLVSTKEQKNAAYFKSMGLQADGRTPSGDPVLLDVDNLIDYVMITLFTQNNDAPLTASGNQSE